MLRLLIASDMVFVSTDSESFTICVVEVDISYELVIVKIKVFSQVICV